MYGSESDRNGKLGDTVTDQSRRHLPTACVKRCQTPGCKIALLRRVQAEFLNDTRRSLDGRLVDDECTGHHKLNSQATRLVVVAHTIAAVSRARTGFHSIPPPPRNALRAALTTRQTHSSNVFFPSADNATRSKQSTDTHAKTRRQTT